MQRPWRTLTSQAHRARRACLFFRGDLHCKHRPCEGEMAVSFWVRFVFEGALFPRLTTAQSRKSREKSARPCECESTPSATERSARLLLFLHFSRGAIFFRRGCRICMTFCCSTMKSSSSMTKCMYCPPMCAQISDMPAKEDHRGRSLQQQRRQLLPRQVRLLLAAMPPSRLRLARAEAHSRREPPSWRLSSRLGSQPPRLSSTRRSHGRAASR